MLTISGPEFTGYRNLMSPNGSQRRRASCHRISRAQMRPCCPGVCSHRPRSLCSGTLSMNTKPRQPQVGQGHSILDLYPAPHMGNRAKRPTHKKWPLVTMWEGPTDRGRYTDGAGSGGGPAIGTGMPEARSPWRHHDFSTLLIEKKQ